jgi:hypothetical protein
MQPTTLQDLIRKELGIEKFPEDVQQKIIFTLTEAIIKKTLITVMDKLSPEDRNTVDVISKSGDTEELLSFFTLKIPDFNEIIANTSREIVADFKKRREQS